MMVEVKSKDELQSVAGRLKNVSSQLASQVADIIGNLSEIEDFDGINVSRSALTIQNNLKNISRRADGEASKLINYFIDITNLDTYDLPREVQGEFSGSGQRTNVFCNSEISGDFGTINDLPVSNSTEYKNNGEFGREGKFKII